MNAKRLLVVDDDADMRLTLRLALELAGYAVDEAANGREALEMQRSRPADVLITDIFMPGQEGIETLWHCKTEFPQTKIIAMSAGGDTSIKLNFLPAAALIGADATLRKPFDADELLDTVRRLLLTPPSSGTSGVNG
jgi:DNA-binding response OmpR family regulator